jgi:hypothetical protein
MEDTLEFFGSAMLIVAVAQFVVATPAARGRDRFDVGIEGRSQDSSGFAGIGAAGRVRPR